MATAEIYEIQAELLRTMSNPIRLEIVHTLRDAPRRVSELAQILEQPQSLVSRHLAVLRNGGVLLAERHGQDVIYRIANPKIIHICDLMREVLMEDAQSRAHLLQGFGPVSEK